MFPISLTDVPSTGGNARAVSAPRCRDGLRTRPSASPSTPPTARSRTSGHAPRNVGAFAYVCKWRVADGEQGSPRQRHDDLSPNSQTSRNKPKRKASIALDSPFYPVEESMPLDDLVLANDRQSPLVSAPFIYLSCWRSARAESCTLTSRPTPRTAA